MKENIKNYVIQFLMFVLGVFFTIVIVEIRTVNTKTAPVIGTKENITITEESSLSKAVEKVNDSIVVVRNYVRGKENGTGTGFIYKTDDKYGYIITNNHVVKGAENIKIMYNDTDEEINATLAGGDDFADIAVIKIEKDKVKGIITLGDSSNSKVGDTVFTVGTPLGVEYKGTVTKGILSGKNREVTINLSGGDTIATEVLQTDAAINPGNSGGPLLNINGEVIGVNSMKIVEERIEGMGFAIPIEVVNSTLKFLENGDKIARPVLGVSLIDVTNTYALYRANINIDKSIDKGVAIYGVADDYPAAKSGLKQGDVILKLNDVEIKNSSHFRMNLFKYNVGDEIKITYYRNNKIETINVKLDKVK